MSYEQGVEICSISQTIGEDFFSCPICFQFFEEPKILPCAHTFCKKCLAALAEIHVCPLCNESFDVPDGDVNRLRSNFHLSALMERLLDREANVPDSRISVEKCEHCQQEDSTEICIDCQQKCCVNCAKIHKNATATKEHRVFTLEEYRRAKFNNPSAVKLVTFCKEHKKEQVKFYCDTCRKPICSDCTVIQHPHGKHEFRNLEEVVDKFRANMTKAIGDLRGKAKEIEEKVKDARDACVKIDQQSKTETEKIEVKFEDIQNKILQERDRLIKCLTKENGARVKKLESHISELELIDGKVMSICGYLSTALQFDDVIGLLTNQDEIANIIQEQLSMNVSKNIETNPSEFKPNDHIGISGTFGAITGGASTQDELNSSSSCEGLKVEGTSFDLKKILIIVLSILLLLLLVLFTVANLKHTCRIPDAIIEVTTGSSMDIVITTEYNQKLRKESNQRRNACLKYPNGKLVCNPVSSQLYGACTISIPGHMVGDYLISMANRKEATIGPFSETQVGKASGDDSQHSKTSKMRDSMASQDQKDMDEEELKQGHKDSILSDQADSEHIERSSSQLHQKDQSIEGIDIKCSIHESNEIESGSLSDEVRSIETITHKSQNKEIETMQGETTEKDMTVIDSETESKEDQCSGKNYDIIFQTRKSGVQPTAEAYTSVQYALIVVVIIVVLAFLWLLAYLLVYMVQRKKASRA